MAEVNLGKFECFASSSRLDRLNQFVRLNSAAMPHQIAAETGCGLKDAMSLLLFLYHRFLADPYILVYHSTHPDAPIAIRALVDGLPDVPMMCGDCEDEIVSKDELSYDFYFKFKSELSFCTEI